MLKKNPLLKILLLLLIAGISLIRAGHWCDFDSILDAAKRLKNGENIYYEAANPKMPAYLYSVFFAWILEPFSSNYFTGKFLWSVLSLLLFWRSCILIKNAFNFSGFTKRQENIWQILSVLLSLQFILLNIAMIQVTMFLLWGIFESINLIKKNNSILAGMVLGLIIIIKIMPVLILPYLFYRRYFKPLVFTTLTFLFLLFLPGVFIGPDYNLFLLKQWWSVINPTHQVHLIETGIGVHSLTAMMVFLTETTGEIDYRRHIFNLNHQTVEIILNMSRLFLFSLSLIFLKSPAFKKETGKLKSFWELSYFVLMIPLLMPHQQKYAFLLVCPMVCYLLYFFIGTFNSRIRTRTYFFVFNAFIVCMIVYSPLYGSSIIGKFLFEFTQHFRLLSFATLFLIPIAVYCSPSRFEYYKNP